MESKRPQVVPERLKKRENFRVLSPNEQRTVENAFDYRIAKWHKEVKPNIIMLTATSATPYGYLIKRAWRVAFPTEKQPIFMNIDPKHLQKIASGGLDEKEEEALPAKERIEKDDRILVFDEVARNDGNTLQRIDDPNFQNHGGTLAAVVDYLVRMGTREENLWVDNNRNTELFDIVKDGSIEYQREHRTTVSLRTPLNRDLVRKAGDNDSHWSLV